MAFNFENGMGVWMEELEKLRTEITADPKNFFDGGGVNRLDFHARRLLGLAEQLRRHYRVVNGR